jgi:hypothetical protein
MKKAIHANIIKKKARVALLISDKEDFEIGKIMAPGQLRQKVCKILSQQKKAGGGGTHLSSQQWWKV